jgi:hypothetical protein
MGYGWSTKQLARINARRAARGQKALKTSIRSEKDAEDYDTEYSKQYGRRRKSIEEEDDETQVVDKEEGEEGEVKKLGTAATPRLAEYKARQEEYQKRLRQRQIEKARGFAPSPFGFQAGSLA